LATPACVIQARPCSELQRRACFMPKALLLIWKHQYGRWWCHSQGTYPSWWVYHSWSCSQQDPSFPSLLCTSCNTLR